MLNNYQIEYRHLKYFLAVAEDLHFRKAADRLFISQPGLSRQIKQMEQDLGIILFERHNRKVVLTKAGKYLQIELNKNLKSLEHILEQSKEIHKGFGGSLKFGYVGSAMQEVLPNLLLAFQKEHPKVHFDLKEMDNEDQIDSLLQNDLDIGFVRLERMPRGLISIPILTECFCLVLPEDHPINSENFKSLKQFKDESFILFDSAYSPSYFEKVMQIFDDSGFSPIISHNTIHAASIYSLVENKLGISIVPVSLQKGYNRKVKFIPLENIKQRTVLSAVWNTNRKSPILNSFINLIK